MFLFRPAIPGAHAYNKLKKTLPIFKIVIHYTTAVRCMFVAGIHRSLPSSLPASSCYSNMFTCFPQIPQLRRQSVCVAGIHRDSLQHVKAQIQGLRDEPFALESFHVKQPSDLADGAFLVPKIVLVGIHCPGRKILDDEEDDGQLDYLYDEACRLGGT